MTFSAMAVPRRRRSVSACRSSAAFRWTMQIRETSDAGEPIVVSDPAMIVAQTVLIMPIIAALTRQVVEDINEEYAEQFASLGVGTMDRVAALLWDARYSLLTVVLAGFGRAVAEVGAVIIVGGNINHVTRVMTTTIALETSKGNLELALALGIVLLAIAIGVNAAVMGLRSTAARYAYA
jgi:tungstate transport system permease protein